MLTLGAFGHTLEALGLTVDTFLRLWGSLGSTLMTLGSIWGVLGVPWGSLGLILEVPGSILGCLGHPKLTQSGTGLHFVDIVKTTENCRVLMGWRGWRLPSWHPNGITDGVAAHLGCLEGCLSGLSGWLGWASWPGYKAEAPGLRPYARAETICPPSSLGVGRNHQPGCKMLAYMDYKATRLQDCKTTWTTRLQDCKMQDCKHTWTTRLVVACIRLTA